MKKYLIVIADVNDKSICVVNSSDDIKVAQAWADGFNTSYEFVDADRFADVIVSE